MFILQYALRIIFYFGLMLHIVACSNNVDYTPPAGSTDTAITHYSFGKMIIDGQDHNADLAILKGSKVRSWSFDYDSHIITPEDFKLLITDKVKSVIIGVGYQGTASLSDKANDFVEKIRKKGIQVQVKPSSDAVKLFNASQKEGLLACFHLNC